MRPRSRRTTLRMAGLCETLLLLCLSPPRTDAALQRAVPQYAVEATIAGRDIAGTVAVRFANRSRAVVRDAVFVLFPNRFSKPDDGINDFNRPFVYPEQEFDPGRMDVEVDAADPTARVEPVSHPGVARGVLVRVPIPPLAPGTETQVRLRFHTRIPHRFGSFGEFEEQLTLNGGWYPYLAALDETTGAWRLDGSPPVADFAVQLVLPPDLEAVLNGQHFASGEPVQARLSSVHYLSLVAAPRLLRDETVIDGTRVVFLHRPARRTVRHSPEPSFSEILLDALRAIVAHRPSIVPKPPAELTIVEAPMRLNLTALGEGMVVVSDRAFKVNWLLRPFHELQVAHAVYGELLRPRLAAREDDDYVWVSEGTARVLADRYLKGSYPDTRSVQDWIELFNIFAIVDRFETVPKIPFVDAFFERARVADPLHTEIMTFNRALPPGHVILAKLREVLGASEFDALIDRCVADGVAFRSCAAAGPVLDQWLQPYPELNYRFDEVALNQPAAEGYHHSVRVRRDASRPIVEPVTVRLRSVGGRTIDLRWDGQATVGEVAADSSGRMWQAVIDPDRRLIEDRRDDNARPPTPQVVLDTAEVEISSTEFGVSGLVVERGRYDYRKDLAFAGFYTNRSIGFTAGGRWHWGTPVDATLFRHNLYAFYGLQSLDAGFTDARRPSVRTPGQLTSLGARYDYSNVFAYDSPTDERYLRLYADWYDRGLGGDYNYVDWGYRLVGSHPLWGYRLIGAAELLNGFSEPLGSSVVPNQGLYSLGGSRSIRGIGAEDELGRNIVMVRTELRHDVYPEVDFNLLDLLVVRRGQVRVFADSGRVSNSAGDAYDVGRFAVGVGVGLGVVYEFLGFFPSVAYLEMATRVDDTGKSDDVQFLFGTRQAF